MNNVFVTVTVGADEAERRCIIALQVVLQVTGVLPGSQLVHHTLDLSSCQQKETQVTSHIPLRRSDSQYCQANVMNILL